MGQHTNQFDPRIHLLIAQLVAHVAQGDDAETPAVEPSDQTSKTVRHAPLVYRVEEIAQLLAISNRAAYNLCNTTKDFKVIRLGTSIRVSKQSFDDWFAAV